MKEPIERFAQLVGARGLLRVRFDGGVGPVGTLAIFVGDIRVYLNVHVDDLPNLRSLFEELP
jgi:hypothetical protein